MKLDTNQLDLALSCLNLGRVTSIEKLEGGSAPVFKLDLSQGSSVVLKLYPNEQYKAPAKDAFAASLLQNKGLPVSRTLLIDDTKLYVPCRFAVTNYLPGVTAGVLRNHPDITSLYRQMGRLLRSLHDIAMPAYGSFNASGISKPASSNSKYMRDLIEYTVERFTVFGADADLTARLVATIDMRFGAVVCDNNGPVFAHDDLHPNNVLAIENDQGKLVLSGLIDFGNARAADAVFDLAKCLFCSEHDAPGSTVHILAGYGTIDHPDPDAAIWFYTLLHRMTMWWWLRQIGVIPDANSQSDLIADLWVMTRS